MLTPLASEAFIIQGLYIAAAGVAATTLFLARKKYAQLEAVKKKEEEGKLEKERREKQINWMFGEGEFDRKEEAFGMFQEKTSGSVVEKSENKGGCCGGDKTKQRKIWQ